MMAKVSAPKQNIDGQLRSRSLTDLALVRLWNDRLSMLAIGIIILLTLAAITAPLITGALGVDPNTTDASKSRVLAALQPGASAGNR